MPEVPDVVPGEPVQSAWGNAVRDRSIQRYDDATDRDTLEPIPAAGAVAWLDDPGALEVYTGTEWLRVLDEAGGYRILALQGTAATPGISFLDAPNKGMFGTAGRVHLTPDGTDRYFRLWTSGGTAVAEFPAVNTLTTAQAPNVNVGASGDQMRRSTAVVVTAGDETDPTPRSAIQARLAGADPSDLLAVIGHLLDRIEALEGG